MERGDRCSAHPESGKANLYPLSCAVVTDFKVAAEEKVIKRGRGGDLPRQLQNPESPYESVENMCGRTSTSVRLTMRPEFSHSKRPQHRCFRVLMSSRRKSFTGRTWRSPWERARLARQSPRLPRFSFSSSTVESAKGGGRDARAPRNNSSPERPPISATAA